MWKVLKVKRFSNRNCLPINYEKEFFSILETMFKFLFISFNDQTHGDDVDGTSIKDIRERWWKNEELCTKPLVLNILKINKNNFFEGRTNI